MADRFGLRFGALSPPLSKQVEDAGLPFDADEMQHHDQSAEWLTYLSLRGVLTDAETKKARRRVARQVEESIIRAARTPTEPEEGGEGV